MQTNRSLTMKPLKRDSQNSKVLECLKRGGWKSMILLSSISGSYNIHSRIAELRKRGHIILNRTKRRPDGTVVSEYQLSS